MPEEGVICHDGGAVRVQISELSRMALERSAALMDRYADCPMDLADATLVALAEERTRFEVLPRI